MATVGLNFGSASSGQGFDVTATVTSILAIEAGLETPYKARIGTLQAQDTALSGLGKSLSGLSTSLQSLTAFDGLFASKRGSSSNTNVLTLTGAGPAAVAGSHSVVVNRLAQTSSVYSDRLASASDTLSGNISIQIGSGASQTLTLDASSNTLAGLTLAINNGSYGVIASVVSDTTGSRLSLVSKTSGAAGQITLNANLNDSTASAAVNFSTGQTGLDAQLNVDGLDTTSASNTVTGAIPGVTFQLLSAATGTPLQIQITNDNTAIEGAVQSFVTAYNATIDGVTTQEGKDASGKAQPLFGDPTLALLQTQLAGSLFSGAASGAITSITQLGLSVNPNGKLALDGNVLDSALNAHFSDVQGFFQSSGSFGQTLTKGLDGLGAAGRQGALYLALQQNTSEETSLNKSISDEEARIAIDKVRLTKELQLANQILQSIPSQLNEIDKIYSATTGFVASTN